MVLSMYYCCGTCPVPVGYGGRGDVVPFPVGRRAGARVGEGSDVGGPQTDAVQESSESRVLPRCSLC